MLQTPIFFFILVKYNLFVMWRQTEWLLLILKNCRDIHNQNVMWVINNFRLCVSSLFLKNKYNYISLNYIFIVICNGYSPLFSQFSDTFWVKFCRLWWENIFEDLLNLVFVRQMLPIRGIFIVSKRSVGAESDEDGGWGWIDQLSSIFFPVLFD